MKKQLSVYMGRLDHYKGVFKRFLSFTLCVSIVSSISSVAFAAEYKRLNGMPVGSKYANGQRVYDVIEFDGTLYYTYQDESITYCAQVVDENSVQFSYAFNDQDKIYTSDVVKISDSFEDGDDSSLENTSANTISEINDLVINNLGAFSGELDSLSIDMSQSYSKSASSVSSSSGGMAVRSSSITTQLTNTFGDDFTQKFLGISNKVYKGTTYAFYCYGYQTTRELKSYSYTFLVKTAVSTIVTWLLVGGFTGGIGWFISAAGAVVETINNAQSIKNAISGKMCAYQCDRTRLVTVTGYSGTMYWAGWTLKTEFIDNGNTWDSKTYYDNKHYDYDDVSGLLAKGYNSFVSLYP